jgi:hypothetical protein
MFEWKQTNFIAWLFVYYSILIINVLFILQACLPWTA